MSYGESCQLCKGVSLDHEELGAGRPQREAIKQGIIPDLPSERIGGLASSFKLVCSSVDTIRKTAGYFLLERNERI